MSRKLSAEDKIMIEKAAKTVGVKLLGIYIGKELVGYQWNPLFDSGQCFEMAYKAGVDICFFDRYDTIEEFRRAIVEAVAKTGERPVNA